MARKLARDNCQENSPPDTSGDDGRDGILSRRSYIRLSITSVAGLIGAGVGSNEALASQSESFTTDFSEYSA